MSDNYIPRVLITGGGKGIGLATVKKFIEDKNSYEIIIVDKDFSKFPKSIVSKVRCIEYNLLDLDNIPKLIIDVGNIDILVNNAGILNALPYDNYPAKKQDEMLTLDLFAPIELIKEFSKSMIKKKNGRIVNLSSMAAHVGHSDIWYGIAKAGIVNVTKSFSKILGPEGIVINCVAPGPVDTDMLQTAPKERKEAFKASSIEKRYATVEEIAETIFWLATSSPRYINGVCIDVNNGIHL
ncbi:MAG: SDR family oxidoreductase [Microgenomates group bacterium]